MKALARKASKLAIYGAAGLCAQKSSASDKILKFYRSSSLAAKIGAGGLVCATPLALKLGAGVALKFAARKILTLGICELSKFAALKCAKLGAHAVVRSFSRTDKFTGERTKKYASADGESSKASASSRRKRTAGLSSASIKKDTSFSKNAHAKKNAATKSAPVKKSPLAKKPVPIAKTASTAKSIAASAASVSVAKSPSVAKSAFLKNAVQNKISAPSAKAIPAKSASQNVKSRRIAKNTSAPAVVIVAKDVAASGASSASTAKQSRRAAKSAPAKSSAAGKS
nr:hypothetical protein [uncultured Campylobacter sp.]